MASKRPRDSEDTEEKQETDTLSSPLKRSKLSLDSEDPEETGSALHKSPVAGILSILF